MPGVARQLWENRTRRRWPIAWGDSITNLGDLIPRMAVFARVRSIIIRPPLPLLVYPYPHPFQQLGTVLHCTVPVLHILKCTTTTHDSSARAWDWRWDGVRRCVWGECGCSAGRGLVGGVFVGPWTLARMNEWTVNPLSAHDGTQK